jgi:uncharacterized membrane protein
MELNCFHPNGMADGSTVGMVGGALQSSGVCLIASILAVLLFFLSFFFFSVENKNLI